MTKFKVFMIMPFTDEFFDVYEMLKEHFIDDFEFSHAGDDVATQQNIIKDIVQLIYSADVIIADLTGLNSNVFYELGIAHTLNKKVIIITKNLSELPFDIRSYRANEYSTHFKKFYALTNELNKYLNGAKNNTIAFGNPVTDFLSTVSSDSLQKLYKSSENLDVEFGESGFLDFFANLEDQIKECIDTILDMTADLNDMNTGINRITSEIETAQKRGGIGASFLRKKAKDAADVISLFSQKMKIHNQSLSTYWNEIERNFLGAIENKHMNTAENKEVFIATLKSLNEMKKGGVEDASSQILGMRDSFSALKGIQRTLNQSVNSLEIDMNQLLELFNQMTTSIDRIIDKSKFIVGQIDFDLPEEKELLLV